MLKLVKNEIHCQKMLTYVGKKFGIDNKQDHSELSIFSRHWRALRIVCSILLTSQVVSIYIVLGLSAYNTLWLSREKVKQSVFHLLHHTHQTLPAAEADLSRACHLLAADECLSSSNSQVGHCLKSTLCFPSIHVAHLISHSDELASVYLHLWSLPLLGVVTAYFPALHCQPPWVDTN